MATPEHSLSDGLWATPTAVPARPTRALTVRALMGAVTASGVVIVVIMLAGVIGSVTRLGEATDAMNRSATALAVVREIELSAQDYERLTDVHLVTHAPEAAHARARSRHQLLRLFARAEALLSSDEERAVLASASRELDTYLAPTTGSTADPGDSRASFDRALSDLHGLEAAEAETVQATLGETRRMASMAEGVAATGGAGVVVGLLLLALAVDRLLSRPLVGLYHSIAQFRDGDMDVRARVGGARELSETSSVFNAMAATLAAQRREELVFLAGVVHDLRNPLSGIKLGLEALRDDTTTAVRTRVLGLLDRQVDRLSHIVGDVLDATKIEAGHLELRREKFDVRRSIREIVSLIAPTSEIHQIAVEMPDDPVILEADPVRVEQVLSNLLSNAIKYSPAGGRIDVRATTSASELIVDVQDRGIGIAREAIPELFAPFRRRAPEVASGSGLGLSVVRRIVKAHGGTIEVESVLGRGSTFRVRLPLVSSCAKPEPRG